MQHGAILCAGLRPTHVQQLCTLLKYCLIQFGALCIIGFLGQIPLVEQQESLRLLRCQMIQFHLNAPPLLPERFPFPTFGVLQFIQPFFCFPRKPRLKTDRSQHRADQIILEKPGAQTGGSAVPGSPFTVVVNAEVYHVSAESEATVPAFELT